MGAGFFAFFIRRPVFASVCSLLIVLCGAVCIPTLPVALYPNLAPPEVSVGATYVGASAQVVESAVTIPLEQQINGTEGMRYMTSTSGSDGQASINIVFDLDRDIDIAAVDVQNRVSQALGRLPREVNARGVGVYKNSPAMVMAVGLYAEHGELSDLFLSNYADVYIRDALKRVRGVSSVEIFNERRYAMRLWLDPLRLAARGLTAADVVRALREQNVQVAAGQLGQQPAPPGQQYQISVRALGRLSTPAEFGRVILKAGADGTAVLLKDIGEVELGAEDYSGQLRFDGRDAVGLGVFQLSNANALDVDRRVRAELERLSRSFPAGMKYRIAFDPTTAVAESIHEVLVTLALAIVLVVAVIYLFLQGLRSTLIPAITIPVSLIGTFLFVKLFGFSINTLSLFGLTLATGLVVDDAIVVIENIERHLHERGAGTTAAEATSTGMVEVASAVLATSIVLVAVFVPVAFFPGTTGRLYRQFSLTIAFSIALSTFNALTLAPALAALLLRKKAPPRLSVLRAMNALIQWLHDRYAQTLAATLRRRRLALLGFVAALVATAAVYRSVPTGFVPAEDQNYFLVLIQAPEGSSLEYTSRVMQKVEATLSREPDVIDVFAIAGWSFGGSAPNRAILFPNLKPLSVRKDPARSVSAVVGRLRQAFADIPGALVFAFPPPTIQGSDSVGGFAMQLLDQAHGTPQHLAEVAQALAAAGGQRPEVASVFAPFTANDPQFEVRIDRERAKALGVPLDEIATALQVNLGSEYVNDFDYNARAYRVFVQADRRFRSSPRDIGQLYVRSERGALVSLDNLVHVVETTAPPIISHFNLFRATELTGEAKPGYSSGQAIRAMEQVAQRVLPPGMTIEWSGLSWEEVRAGGQTWVIFGLGLLFVFLVLSAQYESFVLPFIILLAVPVAILGALLLQKARGLPNDVFCQIGLVMLIGLASKNAILIVEFAEQLRERGRSIEEAAVEAALLRLRPILMTSLAFILGLLPLAFASGAGQEARHSLGTPVLGGMIASTLLNLYFIPALYVTLQQALLLRGARAAARAAQLPVGVAILLVCLSAGSAAAQPALRRVELSEAVAQALSRNTEAQVAAAEVRRAAALTEQVRAAALPGLSASGVYTRLDGDRTIAEQVLVSANQVTANVTLSVPLLSGSSWAQWAQARAGVEIAQARRAQVRQQVAVAVARAYLSILAQRRVVELNQRAREVAQAHHDFARRRFEHGQASRLDVVRAESELRADEGRVESAEVLLSRLQGALGGLLGDEHPVDVAGDPALPDLPTSAADEAPRRRADLWALRLAQGAARRLVRYSFADFLPTLTGTFAPLYQYPATDLQPALGWQMQLALTWPLYDGGRRYGLLHERRAQADQADLHLLGALRQARVDLQAGAAGLQRARRAQAAAAQAAQLSQQAVEIALLSYRAGATTNLEVIDAQRRARDADAAAVVAEDELRQVRLDLLAASGAFP